MIVKGMEERERRKAVEMKNIVKVFPGVMANDHVDFEARTGEIHALLGENGAGKTTLMNILYGIYRPDEGEIYIFGKRVNISSPRMAIKLGIGMVHQHFTLVPKLTVTENIILGAKSTGFLLDLKEAKRRIENLSREYGLAINVDAKVEQLSIGEQQRVEILKMLYRNAKILILDEPTSVLSPPEVKRLFKTLRLMADQGKTVIFVTHKLKEALEISDRITVLRKGRNVGTFLPSEVSIKKLSKLIVGEEVGAQISRRKHGRQKEALKIINLTVLNDKGLKALNGISLKVHKGEILGIAGVAGNGQRELAEAIIGQRTPKDGKILLNGVDITGKTPAEVKSLGVAYIPEDRTKDGIMPDLSVIENLILNSFREKFIKSLFFIDNKKAKEHSRELITKFGIKVTDLNSRASLLSGGNIQRLILASELSGRIKLLVACQPTRGLDVKATEYVHEILMNLRNEGVAILLISEDLDEIIKLSDRIAVIYQGEILGEFERDSVNREKIGMLMAGVRVESGD